MVTGSDIDAGWLGYAGLLLLLGASFAASLVTLRIGLALFAALAMVAALLAGGDVVFAIICALILMANLIQLATLAYRESQVRFSDEERRLRSAHFGSMSAQEARRLIDQGHWIAARRGETLIREKQAAPSLFYLADGTAEIRRGREVVGTLASGALIGEATVLDGDHATGTVLLTTPARLWFVPAPVLRDYLAANPGIAGSLHEGFARALRGKLSSANTRLARTEPL